MISISKLPSLVFLKLIIVYQHTLSFDHGPLHIFFQNGFCRFYPSCSQYGFESIERFGVCRGLWLILWRIFRCNPWSHGGIDPVPRRDKKHGN